MQYKTLVACVSAAVLAVGIACSKNSSTPVSPSPAQSGGTEAGPGGATLKASTPTPQSPTNGQQPDQLVLVAGKSTLTYGNASTPLQYEFDIMNSGGTASMPGCNSGAISAGGGSTVSYTPTCQLEFDQLFTWRIRAVYQGKVTAWSANASFKAPAGGYIRGNEVFDPLVNGKTAGDIFGPVQFIPGQGLQLLAHESHVTYRLPTNLQAGEFSMMILGADEGSEGDKSKVFAMQEGPDENDISTDDYRMTAELRGRSYSTPGQVRYRFKINDHVEDGSPGNLNFSSSRWYFWKFTWSPGIGRLEVREDGPSGRQIYGSSVNMAGRTYKPEPHLVHLGAPIGRASALDATLPGGIYKSVWVSSRPRPAFPGE